MWAQVRHGDSSLSSNWRNVSPRVVFSSKHDLLHNAQLFCLILCHLLKGFFNSVNGPFRGFHLFPEDVFIFFPIFILQGGEAFLHHFFVAIRVMAAFLPLTLYSCLLHSASFLEKVFPHPTQNTVLSPSFSTSLRDTPSIPPPVSSAHLTAFFSFCLQVFLETLLTQVGRICFISFINHHRRQLPIAEGLLAALMSQRNKGFCGTLTALGTKVLSSSSSCSVL